MIFDYQLMFTDKNTAFSSQSSGVLGRILDVSGAGAGKGFRSWIGFAFKKAVSSGGPVNFILETAEDEGFTNPKKIPLSMPPLTTSDMTEGAIFSAPLPVVGMERYCRLNVKADAAVTLSGLECGFVFDVPQV